MLYRASRELLLGYDVYVKDDPDSPEWICYDSLSDPVSLKEADMVSVLDRVAAERGLSYTESCFAKLDGDDQSGEAQPVSHRVPICGAQRQVRGNTHQTRSSGI